ncbi:MAG: hypothetical protein IJG63_04260, partial [Oscillospiraceae bacterium]|nr:hypothetical protein [Oscillospiraceae bacterium]
EHLVLELLLYYANPRGDMNPVAHRLIERFGSISAVFDAPVSELTKISGISDNSAVLLKLVPQLCRRYMESKASQENVMLTTEDAGAYLIPRFFGELDETAYMLCLDAKGKVLYCGKLSQGGVNATEISVRKVVENALLYKATGVILAHNHTSGIAIPSREDICATKRIADALDAVDIRLLDHLVVADGDFVSIYDTVKSLS